MDLSVSDGHLTTVPMRAEGRGARNWCARIRLEPRQRGGIARAFLERSATDGYYYRSADLPVGAAIEFGADRLSRGARDRQRFYGVVTENSDAMVRLESYLTAQEACRAATEYASQMASAGEQAEMASSASRRVAQPAAPSDRPSLELRAPTDLSSDEWPVLGVAELTRQLEDAERSRRELGALRDSHIWTIDRLRADLDSARAESASVTQERDQLRIENARLSQAVLNMPAATSPSAPSPPIALQGSRFSLLEIE